jgi:hypothetical protein
MHGQRVSVPRVLVVREGATTVLVLMDVESDLMPLSDERDASNLLAYDELRQYGVANVFDTAEQAGFCSESEADSAESVAY